MWFVEVEIQEEYGKIQEVDVRLNSAGYFNRGDDIARNKLLKIHVPDVVALKNVKRQYYWYAMPV